LLRAVCDTAQKLNNILDRRERRNALILFGLVLVSGGLDAVGVASIMPFLEVLSDGEAIRDKPYLAAAYAWLGFESDYAFKLTLGLGAFAMVILSLVVKGVTFWALARFGHMRNYTISSRLLRAYLARSYAFFLQRHSGDLGKTILTEVEQVINQCLIPAVRMVAQGVNAFCLIAVMVVVSPVVAAIAVSAIGLCYAGIYLSLRRFLYRSGKDRVRANKQRFKVVQEAFGGIKEVKVSNSERAYLRAYRDPAYRFARHLANNEIASRVPRFAIEAAGVGTALGIVLVLLASRPDRLSEVIPVVGVYAFAGLRLLPALQEIYRGAVKLRFGRPALDALYADLVDIRGTHADSGPAGRRGGRAPLQLRTRIELDRVGFEFEGSSGRIAALTGIDTTIPVGSVTGLVGPTGAGKSTLVDIILGLLRPTEGEVRVDGRPLDDEAIVAWQRAIGYVPQYIFLADETVTANIAFGVPDEEVDRAAVERAARTAEIHDFIVEQLPDAYSTYVGERGVRLSGGQKQRIGIARALYHEPDVLILDEATSALDSHTERAVMDAIHRLSGQKTVILIAHRLATVQACDQLLLLERGRLRAVGSYTDLVERDPMFRDMARKSAAE
jgi:ABC-type multidrug transport system fused ATPase/permease subunit